MTDAIDTKTASMTKIKAWLKANDIVIPVAASDAAIRILVRRRQVRKANNIPGERPIRGVVAASSLTQFKAKVNTMNTKNYGPKDH